MSLSHLRTDQFLRQITLENIYFTMNKTSLKRSCDFGDCYKILGKTQDGVDEIEIN